MHRNGRIGPERCPSSVHDDRRTALSRPSFPSRLKRHDAVPDDTELVEITMDRPAQQQELFMRLLRDAARDAEAILALPGQSAWIRALADDGMSEISRLEESPFAEDQLLAVALRLGGSGTVQGSLLGALSNKFQSPSIRIMIEAQRRAIWKDMGGEGLPLDEAAEIVTALERRLDAMGQDPSVSFGAYAALYSNLWCDPRIGAPSSARRIMLAMVTILNAREEASRPSHAMVGNRAAGKALSRR